MSMNEIWKLPEYMIMQYCKERLGTFLSSEDLSGIIAKTSPYSKMIDDATLYLQQKNINLAGDKTLFFFNGQPFFYDGHFERILMQSTHSHIRFLYTLVSG
jgi:hypothetical protein